MFAGSYGGYYGNRFISFHLFHFICFILFCFLLHGVLQEGEYCMIGLRLLMARDESHMAGGESCMTGYCCRAE
jgi:hypothetical protein